MGTPTTAAITRIGVALIYMAAFIASAGVASAQDVVITTSGDRLVGEIQKVEKDVLTISTDYSDVDFKIEWGKIASIESKRQFLVETFDGKRLSGSLTPGPDKKPVVQIAGTSVRAGGRVVGAAVRAEVLVAVRFRPGLRLQHDAHQLGDAALARDQPLVSGRSLRRCALRQHLQELAGERARHPAMGPRQRLPPASGHALVRQHHAGLPE